jgi:uncharacterized protein YifN (PemK superfamily)
MALWFAPEPGMVLICDFTGYVIPEAVKKRRVVVVSPRRYARLAELTAIVVPLSETKPARICSWHHCIPSGRYHGVERCWAKADLIAHVFIRRLDRLLYDGAWIVPRLQAADLDAIRFAAGAAIGLS